jgi:hypothetical protein
VNLPAHVKIAGRRGRKRQPELGGKEMEWTPPPQGAMKKLAKVEVERRVLTSTASDVPKWKF